MLGGWYYWGNIYAIKLARIFYLLLSFIIFLGGIHVVVISPLIFDTSPP